MSNLIHINHLIKLSKESDANPSSMPIELQSPKPKMISMLILPQIALFPNKINKYPANSNHLKSKNSQKN
jgi:hypothetical protein